MAILHGSWLLQNQGNCLFIWGETWRTLGVNASVRASSDVPQYPLAMKPAELLEWLRLRQITIASSIQQQVETSHGKSLPVRDDKKLTHSHIIALPSYFQQSSDGILVSPVHSATVETLDTTSLQYLQPWQVEGFCLKPPEAVKFLTSLPLNATNGEDAFLGGDLRFWAQIARWSLDLISRCKFLPTLQRLSDHSIIANWQALLDSAVDGTRRKSPQSPHAGVPNQEITLRTVTEARSIARIEPRRPENGRLNTSKIARRASTAL